MQDNTLGGWKCKVYAKSLWLIVKEIREERLQVCWQISTIWPEKPRWSFMATQIGIIGKTETGLNTRSLSSSTAVNIMSGIYNQKCSPQDFYSSQTWVSVVTTLWERCESNRESPGQSLEKMTFGEILKKLDLGKTQNRKWLWQGNRLEVYRSLLQRMRGWTIF